MLCNEYYQFFFIKVIEFDMLWDLEKFALGTQMVSNYDYYINFWLNFWNFESYGKVRVCGGSASF